MKKKESKCDGFVKFDWFANLYSQEIGENRGIWFEKKREKTEKFSEYGSIRAGGKVKQSKVRLGKAKQSKTRQDKIRQDKIK